jgi:hypothetical protein
MSFEDYISQYMIWSPLNVIFQCDSAVTVIISFRNYIFVTYDMVTTIILHLVVIVIMSFGNYIIIYDMVSG